jgi:hypothetical protein
MIRARVLAILMALSLPGFATTAFAQDEMGEGAASGSPEGGDTTAAAGGSMGGDATATPAAPAPTSEAAPSSDSGSSGPSKPISVSLLLGYGLALESGANPFGLGFGARGGYNLGKIYLGARFVYYLGKSTSFPNPFGTPVSVTVNEWELGLEGGYDAQVADKLVVRPLLNLGIMNSGVSGTGISGLSSTDLYIAPGAALLYDVSDSFFLGVDARLQLVFASKLVKGLAFLANAGMRF